MDVRILPGVPRGTAPAPASKSMAHRQLLCAGLAGGESLVRNINDSVDITATIGTLRALGARVMATTTSARVQGMAGGFAAPGGEVNCHESGSTLRFVIPLFALSGHPARLVGAPRLFQRPLDAYADIFAAQGLLFEVDAGGVTLQGPLRAGEYTLRGDVSSQFISGLLFALPLLDGDSRIRITPPLESRSYIELTRQAQSLYGVHSHWADEYTLTVPGNQAYTPADSAVEGDWSNGAVLAVLAALTGGGFVATGLGAESAQGDRVVLDILRRCGTGVHWRADGGLLLTLPAKGLASPGEVDLADCPDLGPILAALALFCKGDTHFVNAGRLRIKESDRIASVQQEFAKLGAVIDAEADSFTVHGGTPLHAATADSHNDHRMVMALSCAAIAAGVPLTLTDAGAITKSWPGYFATLEALGIEVQTL